jgi:hypothetical protein
VTSRRLCGRLGGLDGSDSTSLSADNSSIDCSIIDCCSLELVSCWTAAAAAAAAVSALFLCCNSDRECCDLSFEGCLTQWDT